MRSICWSKVITISFGLALSVFTLSASAASTPADKIIDCHQNGDGFMDFTFTLANGNLNIVMDYFHVPLSSSLKPPAQTRLVRYYVEDLNDLSVSTDDPLLISLYSNVKKVEFLDWRGQLLGSQDVQLNLNVSSIHGRSLDLYEANNSVYFLVDVYDSKSAQSLSGRLTYPGVGSGPNSGFRCAVK